MLLFGEKLFGPDKVTCIDIPMTSKLPITACKLLTKRYSRKIYAQFLKFKTFLVQPSQFACAIELAQLVLLC